jgi:hypothetical protein
MSNVPAGICVGGRPQGRLYRDVRLDVNPNNVGEGESL